MDRIWLRRARRAFRRDEQGATAVEFALIAPLLFLALFSMVEIGMLAMISSGLDNAVFETARRIRTGRDDGPTSAASFEDQVCARMAGSASDCLSRLTISVQKFDRFADANAVVAAPPAGEFNAGSAGDIIIVKADYVWPMLTPFVSNAYHHDGPLSVTLASRAAFKNEPFE